MLDLALDRVFFAAGCQDGWAVGDGGADEVFGGYVDVEFWGLVSCWFRVKEERSGCVRSSPNVLDVPAAET